MSYSDYLLFQVNVHTQKSLKSTSPGTEPITRLYGFIYLAKNIRH